MCISYEFLVIVSLSIIVVHEVATQANLKQFLDEQRQKVHRLEKTGRIQREHPIYHEPELNDGETYDFIVVGAGSAGSALIRRLTEIPKWRVLVLEAGGTPDIISEIPFVSLQSHVTDLNWRFYSEREPNVALGLKNQRMHLPRGKGLGGSSLLNYMIYTRGSREDYDRWASLGNPGWSYEELLPVFERLENCTIRYQDDQYRGHFGPIGVENAYTTKSSDIFLEAAQNAGYNYVDYNGRSNRGVSIIQANFKKGLRCSGELCYIRPVKDLPNLTIRLHSQVTKILIKDDAAYGVEFFKRGRFFRAYANKEVILSAGVFNSPHILLLSGIGPKQQLTKFGIKPVKDLPVGRKMYDHPGFHGLSFTINSSIVFDGKEAVSDESYIKLYNEGEGPLKTIGAGENILFTTSPFASTLSTDLELLFAPTAFTTAKNGLPELIRVADEVYDYTYKPYEGQNAISYVIVLLHPQSYGRLELQSSNPFVYPKIYEGFFTDPQKKDIKVLTAGIREAIRIISDPPFDKYGAKLMDKPILGCQHLLFGTDQYWECALRHLTSSIFHQTYTCKMGPETDPEAVVDPRLKVHGIHHLRVVDTSVFPTTVSAHTNVPAYMVGEKAAEIIKEDYFHELCSK